MDSLKNTYEELVKDALLERPESFSENVKTIISYKLAEAVNDIKEDVASSFFDYKYEIDEAIGSGSKSFTFRSTSDARTFSKGLMEMGMKKKEIMSRGNTVVIKNIPERDVEEMVTSMAKDMKARISEDLNLLVIMKETLDENLQLPIVLNDETFVVLESSDCGVIINLHDSLNSENQIKLRRNLMESNESFNKILDFAYASTNESQEEEG